MKAMKQIGKLLAGLGLLLLVSTPAFAGGSYGFSFGFNSGYRSHSHYPRYGGSYSYGNSYYPPPAYYYYPPPATYRYYYNPPTYYYYGGSYYCR